MKSNTNFLTSSRSARAITKRPGQMAPCLVPFDNLQIDPGHPAQHLSNQRPNASEADDEYTLAQRGTSVPDSCHSSFKIASQNRAARRNALRNREDIRGIHATDVLMRM